jgi:hypothetical protein
MNKPSPEDIQEIDKQVKDDIAGKYPNMGISFK